MPHFILSLFIDGLKEKIEDNIHMKKIIFILLFISFPCLAVVEADPKPFVTDYCTLYVEGTRAQPNLWRHCCLEHDLYCWAGGSLDDKNVSDLKLKACVQMTGARTQAILIYAAVVIGGHSPIHIKSKQWGNTWENRPRYLSLTESETSKVIYHLESNYPDLSSELKQSFKEQLNSRLDAQ